MMVTVPGLDQPALRRVNTAVVLRALAATTEDATTQLLVEQTGLSRRTIDVILGALVERGWALPVEPEGGGGVGRPARRFRFAADHRIAAGVRVSTDFAVAVVTDLHGQVLGRASRALRSGTSPDPTVDDVVAAVQDAADAAQLPLDRIGAGAIAAGGVISPDGVVRRLVNAPEWSGYPLAEALALRFGVPWSAENDANLGALAEYWSGAARGRSSVAWLIHGSRTGVGFVLNGELHRGANGAAGELIESRVLGLGTNEHHPVGLLTSPDPKERAAALEIVRAATAGDEHAGVLVDELAGRIANLVDVLAWTVAPELVVLGGGLEVAGDALLPRIRAHLDAASAPHVELASSTTGQDAPIAGAVRRALDLIEADLYATALQ